MILYFSLSVNIEFERGLLAACIQKVNISLINVENRNEIINELFITLLEQKQTYLIEIK